jgi:probable phosphomutase (TIGR03848 family)
VTLLLLVRHALTDATGKRLSGQARGIHLSEAGREQANTLAERMAPVPLAAVYASPLERCVETARAMATPREMDVRVVPALTEVAYGAWTGRPLAQLARTSLWNEVQRSPSSARFPGGETLAEVQRRAVAALDELATTHPRKAIAVVSHADVIRLALAHYAGIHLDLFQRLVVGTTSVSAVVLGGVPRIVRMNDTGTLDDLVPRRPPQARPRGRHTSPDGRSGRRRAAPARGVRG